MDEAEDEIELTEEEQNLFDEFWVKFIVLIDISF